MHTPLQHTNNTEHQGMSIKRTCKTANTVSSDKILTIPKQGDNSFLRQKKQIYFRILCSYATTIWYSYIFASTFNSIFNDCLLVSTANC